MQKYRLRCGGCYGTFVVEDEIKAERCPRCGTEHRAPWSEPNLGSSPLPEAELGVPASEQMEDGEDIQVADEDGQVTITIDAG